MIQFRDMVQWSRLITPRIVPLFFWSVLGTSVLAGVVALIKSIVLVLERPLTSMLMIAATILAVCVAVTAARLISEFFLVSFRANAHLYRIRTLIETAEQEPRKGAEQTHLPTAA